MTSRPTDQPAQLTGTAPGPMSSDERARYTRARQAEHDTIAAGLDRDQVATAVQATQQDQR